MILLIGVSIVLVPYFSPENSVTINFSIIIVNLIVIESCSQFVKD